MCACSNALTELAQIRRFMTAPGIGPHLLHNRQSGTLRGGREELALILDYNSAPPELGPLGANGLANARDIFSRRSRPTKMSPAPLQPGREIPGAPCGRIVGAAARLFPGLAGPDQEFLGVLTRDLIIETISAHSRPAGIQGREQPGPHLCRDERNESGRPKLIFGRPFTRATPGEFSRPRGKESPVAGEPDDDALIVGFFDRSLAALQAAAKDARAVAAGSPKSHRRSKRRCGRRQSPDRRQWRPRRRPPASRRRISLALSGRPPAVAGAGAHH